MKKHITFLIGFMVLFISCNVNSNSRLCKIGNADNLYSDRRMQLIEYSLTGDYKVSEDEMVASLKSFLDSKDGISEQNSLTTKSGNNKKYNIVKKNSKFIEFINKENSSDNFLAVKSTIEQSDDYIELSMFSIESDEEKGVALMSDDRRLGEVLFYQEIGDLKEDITGDSFMQVYALCLQDYINKTADIWDSIDENDYEVIKKKYGITDEDIEKAKLINESNSVVTKGAFGIDYGKWSEPKRKVLDMKTNWG